MNLLAGLRILKTILKNSIYVCIERTTFFLYSPAARSSQNLDRCSNLQYFITAMVKSNDHILTL